MSQSLHDTFLKVIEQLSSKQAGDAPMSKTSLAGIKFIRFLSASTSDKNVCMECQFDSQKAVIILAKTSFPTESLGKVIDDFGNFLSEAENVFRNDKYGSYLVELLAQDFNRISMTIIHPANQKDINKYVEQQQYFVVETPELYKTVTLPYIETQTDNLAWLYNVLDKKAEVDRIVYEECLDTEDGFLVAKDMKWKTKGIVPTEAEKIDLYVNAIVSRRHLRSLRDLRSQHLPLLEAINTRGRGAVAAAYGLDERELRLFVHYQPSFYHLHVHFTHVKNPLASALSDRAHLLENIIGNIRLLDDYYAKATLSFVLSEKSPLKLSDFK